MADSIWIPQRKQAEVLLAHCYEKLIGWSRGGGKTDTGIVWLVEPRYIQNKNYRALILRKNYEDLKDWRDRAKKHFAAYGGYEVGAPTVFRFPNGVEFRMWHLKDRKSYEKYLGHEYQKILIEELTTIPDERYYIEIMGSLRSSDPTLDPCMMSTTNPWGPWHTWVKKRFVDYLPHGKIFYPNDLQGRWRIFIPMSLDDNKILREADPWYEMYLEGLKEVDPILYKRWRKGDWDIFEGQFFDTFDRDIHVVAPFIPPRAETKRFICHFDYGFSAPSAVYWTKKDTQGRIVTYRELYKTGLTYRMLAREILRMQGDERPDMYICDPAIYNKKTEDTGKTAKDIFAEEGITLTPWKNDRLAGANLIRDCLYWVENESWQREPITTITSNCEHLIGQLANLIRDDKNVEDIKDGQEDHAYDWWRYGIMEIAVLGGDIKKVESINKALHRKNPWHEQLAP